MILACVSMAMTTRSDALIDIYAGGGLGRTPEVLGVDREKLPAKDLLTYTEALMRVYNRYGRRDNKYKARIKILVRAMTPEGFKAQVDAEWERIKDSPSTVPAAELHRLRNFFRHLPLLSKRSAHCLPICV